MPVDRVKEFFKSRDDLLPLMNEVLNEKILNFLKQEATLVQPETTDKEAAAEDAQDEADASPEDNDELGSSAAL